MVEPQPSKLVMRVRFPSPAPAESPLRLLAVERARIRQGGVLGVVAGNALRDEWHVAAAQAAQIPLSEPALDVLPHGARAGALGRRQRRRGPVVGVAVQ